MNAFLSGKKTHLLVFGGLVSVLVAFLTGDVTLGEAINNALSLGAMSTIRMGVAKAMGA